MALMSKLITTEIVQTDPHGFRMVTINVRQGREFLPDVVAVKTDAIQQRAMVYLSSTELLGVELD
jgi:hypothetical protein